MREQEDTVLLDENMQEELQQLDETIDEQKRREDRKKHYHAILLQKIPYLIILFSCILLLIYKII